LAGERECTTPVEGRGVKERRLVRVAGACIEFFESAFDFKSTGYMGYPKVRSFDDKVRNYESHIEPQAQDNRAMRGGTKTRYKRVKCGGR